MVCIVSLFVLNGYTVQLWMSEEDVPGDTMLITSEMNESDLTCRQVIEECIDSSIQVARQQQANEIERKKAATDIVDGFIRFNAWCYMNEDCEEQNPQSWEQEKVPDRIVADSWSSNIVPIRRIAQRKEQILEIKSSSKTNSVRSGQSTRSKMSKGKIKRSSVILSNIIDENSEEKVEVIQLSKHKIKVSKKSKEKKSKLTKKSSNANQEMMNALSIDLSQNQNQKHEDRQSLHIGLKTQRLSMKSSNAYKFHPNKPYTYDHTGQKMCVTHMKPERMPNNMLSCCCVLLACNRIIPICCSV